MVEEQKQENLGEDEGSKSIYAGLSKGQIKKLKEKMKAEKEAAAKAGVDTTQATASAAAEENKEAASKAAQKKPAAKGKKGGPGAAIAEKIKAQQEAKAREQAEFDRLQKEEDEREAAKEAVRLAEAKKIKDEKEAKKKAKKDHIDDLKSKGLYLTKKQQQQKAAAEARRRALKQDEDEKDDEAEADGAEGDDAQAEEAKKTSHKAVRTRKKKDKNQVQNQPDESQANKAADAKDSESEDEPVAVSAPKQPVAKKEVVKVVQEQAEFDDWEEAIDEVAEAIVQTTKHAADLQQPEEGSESSEEETKESKHETATTQTAAKGGKKKIIRKEKEEEKETSAAVFDNIVISSKDKDDAAKRMEFQKKRLEEVKRRREKAKQKKLRCPIICVMGHVDTGKTLILDKLRRTNVQAGEAGGITQQIGATWFPEANLIEFLKRMNDREKFDLQLPGFLVIDTPGHESFTNLRTRGSSLCDMAVLVVDIMHGLEQQTLESIQMLKSRNTPFCIALNKIDRLNQWKPQVMTNSRDTLESQSTNAQSHFEDQVKKTVLAFNEQGFNVALYWENDSPEDTLSFVPTSAITGEGLPDLMFQLCRMGQSQESIRKKLEEKDEFECTVIEVKVIEGHGTTVDVVLVNGVLKVGETIVISGMNGPIVTKIRALLTPHPMKEMRVKGDYLHHKSIKGAMGIKISAPDMDHAMAGTQVFRCYNDEEVQEAKQAISDDLIDILDKYVDRSQEGVSVQASTIGSLEALLEYLYQQKIPVCSVNIGPVHRKDIMKCMKSTTAGGERQHKEYATLLAFDVKVTQEARDFAEEEGIMIFTADIIYHLFDSFTEYVKQCRDERKGDQGQKAVFPCILEMVKDACFNAKSPIIIGVNVTEGVLKIGTPLCIPMRDALKIGHVQSIEVNKKPVKEARAKDGSVAVKIHSNDAIAYGRHFNDTDQIASLITRDTIDTLKEHFRDDMTKEDWQTVLKLKKIYGIA